MARPRLAEPKTRLTGAPGALDQARRAEVWTSALSLPDERSLPSKRRRLNIVLGIIFTVVAVTVGGWKLANINSSFDPSVDLDTVQPPPSDAALRAP